MSRRFFTLHFKGVVHMTNQQMDLREKIGQLFMVTIEDSHINGETINLLTQFHPGGILLRQNNMQHPKQIHRLTSELQHYNDSQMPLFISAQEESALNGMAKVPAQQLLGAVDNRLYTKQAASINGKEWQAAGINMNMGPGLHPKAVDNFSEDIQHIAHHGRAAIEGLQKNNVLPAATHFLRENESIPSDTPLYKTTLHPYLYAIEHGLKAIVTSNINVAVPFLRETAHFDGLLFYEAINDDNLSNNALHAIQNGCDMILLKCTNKTQLRLMETVYQAVRDGDIPEEKIDLAVDRIVAMKQKYHMETPDFDRDIFLDPFAVRFMKQLEEKQTATK